MGLMHMHSRKIIRGYMQSKGQGGRGKGGPQLCVSVCVRRTCVAFVPICYSHF